MGKTQEKIIEKVSAEFQPVLEQHDWPEPQHYEDYRLTLNMFLGVAVSQPLPEMNEKFKEKIGSFFMGDEDPVTARKKLKRYVLFQTTRLFAQGVVHAMFYVHAKEPDREKRIAVLQSSALIIYQKAAEKILENLQERGVKKSTLDNLHQAFETAFEEYIDIQFEKLHEESKPEKSTPTSTGNPGLFDGLLSTVQGWFR